LQGFSDGGSTPPASTILANRIFGLSEPELWASRRANFAYFAIFIFGNFRLTAVTTDACSGFPELLAKASRAWAASGMGYFLAPFFTKSDFGSFFLAAAVSLAIFDVSPVERT